jgi:DNA-binding transcriptional LysR family regulator
MSPLRQRSNASVITRKRGANCNHSCYDIFTETITGTYMNLRQLEILRAVIRHRTTVAAADELALSQPAISNALKAMETQAGFALFERVNNRLFPTTEAMALYKESDAIFALHAKLENRVRDLRECRSGHLSIVATPPLAYSVIPPALSGFLRRRQQTRVFFDVRRYEGIIDGVLSRVAELGFALGLSHHPGIAHEVVHTGEMVCVLPPKHPLAERPVISASDLVGLPFIGLERGTRLGEAVRESFAQAGAPFQPTVEVRYCNTACVLAAAGVGAAVVDSFSPRQGGSHDLIVRPFTPKTPAVAYMLWSEAEPLSRMAKAFLNEVRQVSRLLG